MTWPITWRTWSTRWPIRVIAAIVRTLRSLENDETMLVQSGKPVGVLRTHADAPRVLIANSNLVPAWATWEHFRELDRKGLMMFGQMTAGSWIYIGSQGIVQGTYETFAEMGRQHYDGDLAGRWILTAGLGGQAAQGTDKLLGGNVRSNQRETDQPPHQPSAGQEVVLRSVFAVSFLASAFPKADGDYGNDEGDEDGEIQGSHYVFLSIGMCGGSAV